MNKCSQLPLTPEVATVPKLRAAAHSTDTCTECCPGSKTASKPQVPSGACWAYRVKPCLLLAPSLEADLLSLLCLWHWPSSVTPRPRVRGQCCPSLNTGQSLTPTSVSHSCPLPEAARPYAPSIAHKTYVPNICQVLTWVQGVWVRTNSSAQAWVPLHTKDWLLLSKFVSWFYFSLKRVFPRSFVFSR